MFDPVLFFFLSSLALLRPSGRGNRFDRSESHGSPLHRCAPNGDFGTKMAIFRIWTSAGVLLLLITLHPFAKKNGKMAAEAFTRSFTSEKGGLIKSVPFPLRDPLGSLLFLNAGRDVSRHCAD